MGKPGARNGIKNGISFLIDVETYEYAFFPRSAKGFTIALSDSRDRPVVSQQGFYIQPGTETLVSMQVTGSIATPGAMTFFNPARRNCYNDEEFQPLYFNKSTGFRYTMSNCLYASMIHKV